MTTKDQHIANVLENRIRPLLEEAAEVIEALKPGEKIPATELAKFIAERHGMTGPQLYPTLKFMFDGYPNRIIKRGSRGGIENPLVKTDSNKSTDPADPQD